MSIELLHFGTENATLLPDASQCFTVQHNQLENLHELLSAFKVMDPPAPALLHTVAAHLSEFFDAPPDRIRLEDVADCRLAFTKYLAARRYKRNTVKSYSHYRVLLVEAAEELGWRRQEFAWPTVWKEFVASEPSNQSLEIAKYAVGLGRSPQQLSDEDLNRFCCSIHGNGGCFARASQWIRNFRKHLRSKGLVDRFPNLQKVALKERYGLKKDDWPESLKKEVTALLRWKQDDFAPGRPRNGQLSKASAQKLENSLVLILGFAVNIYGCKNVGSLTDIVTEDVVTSFTGWSINERRKSGRSFKGELNAVYVSLHHNPRYKTLELSWFPGLMKSIPIESLSEAQNRKEGRMLPYEVVREIPKKLRSLHNSALRKNPKKLALQVRDELLLTWLITLAWRQRNIRECRISGDKPNLFKAPFPKSAAIAKPSWVSGVEARDPGASFWQFLFREDETKMGNRVHAILPRTLIKPLEEYLGEYRGLLLNKADPGTLFLSMVGLPLDSAQVTERVRILTMRHGGRAMSPHLFRDSLAYKWLVDHPQDYLTISKILWHTNIQTTLQVYGARFNESNGVCRLDEWIENSNDQGEASDGPLLLLNPTTEAGRESRPSC